MRILEVTLLYVVLAMSIHQVQAGHHIRGVSNLKPKDVSGAPPVNRENGMNKLRMESCASPVVVRPFLPRITCFTEVKIPSDSLARRSLKKSSRGGGSRSSRSSSKTGFKFGKLRGASAVGLVVGLCVYFAAMALILFIWWYSVKKGKEAKHRKAKESEAQLVDIDDRDGDEGSSEFYSIGEGCCRTSFHAKVVSAKCDGEYEWNIDEIKNPCQ